MLFAHGFGCDQTIWRLVAPTFEQSHSVVLFDLPGSGNAHPSAYDRARHSTLEGYAHDVLTIITALKLENVIFVGHSVSSIIGILAAVERPEAFDSLILVAPSPCYLNRDDYIGGFSREDIDGLIDMLDSNYLGWARSMAPVIMGTPERPDLVEELENRFCRTDPEIARQFAKVTFLSDNREDLARVSTPSLVMQVARDAVVPVSVGEYMHRRLQKSKLTVLDAHGHCPHLSAPQETIAAMRTFMGFDTAR
ncbi:MAG: alpha/beta hydrolase [Polyangiaceae bacterium]